MRLSRLLAPALLVPALLVAVPADAATKRPVKRAVAVKVAAPTGYRHMESLDFTAGANRKPAGSTLPVLYPYQHCSGFFVPQNIPYFNGPVLVCG